MQGFAGREGGAFLALLEDDYRQSLRRDVGRALVVDDLDLLAVTDPGGELFQRDVAALLGVVQLATAVPLDKSDHDLPP